MELKLKQMKYSLLWRVNDYRNKLGATKIDPDDMSVNIITPNETSLGGFFDPVSVANLEDLPKLSDIHQDFAITYATMYLSRKDLAKRYCVSIGTIDRWVALPRIQAVVYAIRQQKRLWMQGQDYLLERKAYRLLNRILDSNITGDNIATLLRSVEYVFMKLQGERPLHGGIGGVSFNSVINVGGESKVPSIADMRDVSTETKTEATREIVEAKKKNFNKLIELAKAINE